MAERLLTTGQAAAIAGVTPMSVIRWCEAGELRFERTPGGHRRIALTSLRERLLVRGTPFRSLEPSAPPWSLRVVALLRSATLRRLKLGTTAGSLRSGQGRPTHGGPLPLGSAVEPHDDPYAALTSVVHRPPRAVVVEAAAVDRALAFVDALLGASVLADTWIVVVGGDARELVTRPVTRFDGREAAEALRAAVGMGALAKASSPRPSRAPRPSRRTRR